MMLEKTRSIIIFYEETVQSPELKTNTTSTQTQLNK